MTTDSEKFQRLLTLSKTFAHDLSSPIMIAHDLNQLLHENLPPLLAGYQLAASAGLLTADCEAPELANLVKINQRNIEKITHINSLNKTFKTELQNMSS